jgi:hypothetical protein
VLTVDVIGDQVANTSDHHHNSGEDHDPDKNTPKEFARCHID